MIIIKGNLWDEIGKSNLILFTANSCCDHQGCLIMGAGCAAEARDRYPDLPKTIGTYLREYGLTEKLFHLWLPHEINHPDHEGTLIGALQTKKNWAAKSSLELVQQSIGCLRIELAARPWLKRVALPLPGCGLGMLRRQDVLPYLEKLPDHVVVYEYR